MYFHRPAFQKILLQHATSVCKTYTNKRLESFVHHPNDPSRPIVLTFQDGTSALCDLLVGADGLKSVVRSTIMHQLADEAKANGNEELASEYLRASEPAFSGTYSYRTPITAESLQGIDPDHKVFKEPQMVRSTPSLHSEVFVSHRVS